MELQPDMVLGEDIQDQNHVIYPAGTTVTPQIIEKLKRYNLVCVTIMEDIDFATTHYEKIRFDSNFKAFERAYPIFLAEYKLAMKQLLVMGRKPADIFPTGARYARTRDGTYSCSVTTYLPRKDRNC